MKNPLLRSAGVLSALFYQNVVLTEGDSDRAFYQEVNQRLLALMNGRGIPNALFINANGKDAIPVMMEPLRQLGIPAAGIYDLDFVKDGGSASSRRLGAAGVPNAMFPSLGAARGCIKTALEATGSNYKREGGTALLGASKRIAAESYIQQLQAFGIFLAPVGEVEGWLKSFGIGGHAAEWLIPMFEKMGDEGSANYILPGDGGVWGFLDKLNEWLRNPDRLGAK